MSGILVIFHTPSNAGYAMAPLERLFFQVAMDLVGRKEKIHFAFKNLDMGMPDTLPTNFSNVFDIDRDKCHGDYYRERLEYIKSSNISLAFCFDLQVRSPVCDLLREGGIKNVVSYWGAGISGENRGVRLLMKKVEVLLSRNKPDMFIFESEAMRYYAIHGRGIARSNTRVVHTGVDVDKFRPSVESKGYVRDQFGLHSDDFIVFYSGHMEKRKGVHVIIQAAMELQEKRCAGKVKFLICGNRAGEELPFIEMMEDSPAANSVIFAGYRTDLDKIIPGCDIGVIASTGWDSFPMSSLEMASCGLPIVVSKLQGLKEVICEGKSGLFFEPGDAPKLAEHIELLWKDAALYQDMSEFARDRIASAYTVEHHRQNLLSALGDRYSQ